MPNNRLLLAPILFGIAFIGVLAGCAETPSKPVSAQTMQPAVAGVITPEGWVQEYNAGGQLIASRDGYPLQIILVAARSNIDAFPAIKKGVTPSTLPSEVADLNIANIKAMGVDAELVENEPAQVAGRSGYRLLLRHFDGRGLEWRQVVYGAVDEKYFYRLYFEAPALYFFARDLPAFEGMVKSFQRSPDFDTTVKGTEAGTAPTSSPRWAVVRLDAPVAKKK